LWFSDLKFEHSCSPNAIWIWNRRTFTLTLFAARKIATKTEITISYFTPLDEKVVRRAKSSAMDFECKCDACVKTITKGNTQRETLRKWIERPGPTSFTEWMQSTGPKSSASEQVISARDLCKLADEALEALIAANLHALRQVHKDLVFWLVGLERVLGNQSGFKKRLEIAIEVWKVDARWSKKAQKMLAQFEGWLRLEDCTQLAQWGSRK
jgi:hypothetical protein